MKKEYDFSAGKRGKFYHPNIDLNFPVYLEADVANFIRNFAKKKGAKIESMVNDWLKKDIEIIQTVR